ncbi:MAG: hypothetical protein Q8R26_00500, partial [bacterium]|nr:hypothetical protein [bacterium]
GSSVPSLVSNNEILRSAQNDNTGGCKKRLGLIAEEAPSEVLSADGKGVDVYKMASFLLAGMKAQQTKIEELDQILGSLTSTGRETSANSATNNAWSVDQTGGLVNVSFFGNLNLNNNSIYDLKKITGYLGRWSVDEGGRLVAVEVETEKLKVKSSAEFGTVEKPIGITIYDEVTKEPFCVKIKNGAMVSEAGICGDSSVAPLPQNDGTSAPQNDMSTTTATTTP